LKLKSVGFTNKNQMTKKKVLKSSLGIDVSKASLSMCLCFLEEDLNKRFVSIPDVSNDLLGFKTLLKRLKSEGFKDVFPLIIMEARVVYHESLAYFFDGKGADVCIMQSGRVKKYAQSLDQRSKTDALDSKMLAMLCCERTITPWSPPAENLQHLKMLSRERSLLLKEKNSLKNRLHAIETSEYSNKKTLRRFENRAKLL
jgi:transposase